MKNNNCKEKKKEKKTNDKFEKKGKINTNKEEDENEEVWILSLIGGSITRRELQ